MQKSDTVVAAVHVRIYGKVQGVNYRWETRRAAQGNELTGWVRNCRDGSVEAVFEGSRAAVGTMLDWCRQGPPFSQVDSVDTEWKTPSGQFSGFEIIR